MQFDILAAAWTVTLIACAIGAAALLVIAARHRKKWLPPLEELVTLDSRGWFLVASVASAGAFVMIATSQLFSSAYWIGLAVDSDGLPKPERMFPFGWLTLITITTITAFALSVIFELVADIGAPTASGLKKEKRKGTPEFLLIVTALAIVMSAASKWGYYEDRRQVRATEAARVAVVDGSAQEALAAANATIARLEGTPSLAVIAEAEKSIAQQIEDARKARDDAATARDALPDSHSTNRLKFQEAVDRQADRLADLEERRIAAQVDRENLERLAKARADKAAAEATLAADAGKLTGEKKEIVKIGDTILIRLIRSGLHQALCFLFPIIALDAWTAHRAVAKREEAARKGAETRRMNNPNAVRDAEYAEAEPGDFEPPPPRYLPPAQPAEGEAGGVTDAEFEGDEAAEDPQAGADDTEADEGADHDDSDDDGRDDLEPRGS